MTHAVNDGAGQAVTVPPEIGAKLAGYDWSRILVGESGAMVFRLRCEGRPGFYLKSGAYGVADAIRREYARIQWLQGRIAAPDVAAFAEQGDEAFLLLSECRGETAYRAMAEHKTRRSEIAFALGAHLARLHALPVEDCPFDSRLATRLTLARQRVERGDVDEDDFDAARAGWSAQMVWQRIAELGRAGLESVVTHGDYSLDNIIIDGDRVSGLIDFDRLGIADPYQDIAIALNCLEEFGTPAQEQFLRGYGLDAVDTRRLELHLCLDELF